MESTKPYNEQLLISKIRKGDVSAFDSIYKTYSSRLYSFALSLLKNPEDAKEIVQDCFLKIWANKEQLKTDTCFKSFLFKTSYNLIIDLFRKKSKEKEYQAFLFDHFDTFADEANQDLYFEELSNELNKQIDKLPSKRKEIFILSRHQGLSHKQIAQKLEISSKTVENQIGLCLKFLKANLKDSQLINILFLSLFI